MKKRLVTRRDILHGIGAGTVLAAAPQAVRALNKTQVLVIGAGLSGLATARLLEVEGVNVQVIEGRQRIGGRVLSFRNIPGNPEAGGTSFAPGYARLVDTANSLDVGLINYTPRVQYIMQRDLILDHQVVRAEDWPTHPRNPFPDELKTTMPWAYAPMVIGRNNPLESVDGWIAAENAKWDISLHDWFKQQGLSDEIIEVAYNMNVSFGDSAHDVSALQLFHSAAFANLQRELASGIRGYTAVGGNQAIPEAMAASLHNEVHLGKEVLGIRSASDAAEVHCSDGTVYRADHVVCSIPFAVLRRLHVEPMITGLQAKAIKTLGAQVMSQMHMVAKRPFWEDDGLVPGIYGDSLSGMVVPEHKGEDPAEITSLSFWLRGQKAAWLDQVGDEQAKAMVIADYERIRPAAKGQLEVLGYHSWYRDPFCAGDWAIWKPGQISDFATVVAEPHGRIHFCGEHTAVTNRGMEGAMESGERAAFEIFERL